MLSGNLNLLGSGIWIFKSASTLITSPGSSVTGGDPCNVWWVVPSSATMDTTTAFVGNIFALTSICLKTSARLKGRTLAQTGGVTLQANSISLVCNGPTAVEISQFSAKRSDGTIVLRWIALFGGDVLGYRIYRTALTTGVSLAGLRANATSISPLISATDSGAGAYSFVDAATTSGARYAYRLVAYSPDRTVGDLALAQMGPMPTFLPLVAID